MQAGAALTVVPLFGLLRRGLSRRASWLAAAFWPAVPALAVFIPKSDCLFPLLSTALLWLWLRGLDRQSLLLAAATGLAFCVSLSLSLAFLPVALIAALIGIGHYVAPPLKIAGTRDIAPEFDHVPTAQRGGRSEDGFCRRDWLFGACFLSWVVWKINFSMIWWLNFRNHGGFYEQYPRTYWKWLLINPFEFAVAAGVPLSVLAVWGVVRQWRQARSTGVSCLGRFGRGRRFMVVWKKHGRSGPAVDPVHPPADLVCGAGSLKGRSQPARNHHRQVPCRLAPSTARGFFLDRHGSRHWGCS